MRKLEIETPRSRDSTTRGLGLDVETTAAFDDADEVTFPARCRSLYLQHRADGRIYAELVADGGLMSAGVGGTGASACRAAIAKLALAA